MRAALAHVARSCEPQPVRCAEAFDMGDELPAKGMGLRSHRLHVHIVKHVERRIQRGQRQDGRSAALVAQNAGGGAVGQVKCKRRGMSEPAGQRRLDLLLKVRPHIQKARRARPAIHIFIGAADGEIDVEAGKVERQRPGRVRQINQNQRAVRMRLFNNRRHVMRARRSVIHMGDADERRMPVNSAENVRWRGKLQNMALVQLADDAFGNVKVAWEVSGVRNHRQPFGVQFKRC